MAETVNRKLLQCKSGWIANIKDKTNFFPSQFLIKLITTTEPSQRISFTSRLSCEILTANIATFDSLEGIREVNAQGRAKRISK